MIEKEPLWNLPGSDINTIAQSLIAERAMPPHFACMLAIRGIHAYSQAEQFVNPALSDLRDPFQMKDLSAEPEHAEKMNEYREKLKAKMDLLHDTFEESLWYRDNWVSENRIILL